MDQIVAPAIRANLVVSAMRPFAGVPDHSGPNHIQIDISQAVFEMLTRLDRGAMIPVLPEGATPPLAPVVFLGDPARYKVHGTRNHTSPPAILDKKMDMVRSQRVVENAESVPLFCIEQPLKPAPPIPGELQEEFLLMTAMSKVPDLAWDKIPIGSRH
jgi:hypothetical protein